MAVTDVGSLRRHLQWAIELEHGTLPPYLCAVYSIKAGHNVAAAEAVHSVFMEEMLHLTLAANLLNAVGGSPRIDTPELLPRYPIHLPHSNCAFEVPLQRFSPEAIETFLKIERPAPHGAVPADENYETIGQFYAAIREALEPLARTLGEAALFSGDRRRQVTDDLYYGGSGRIIAVHDLESALAALEEIVEQGEGLDYQHVWDGDREMFHPEREEVAHYFRFQEIAAGRQYRRGDTPQSGPTGEALTVDWDAVWPMRANPCSADYREGSEARVQLDAFNRSYCAVLHLLEESFNGSPRLLAVATGEMYALRQQAIELMRLPSGDGETTVGPSFEYVSPELRHQPGRSDQRIVVLPNGPYVVYGDVPLVRRRKVVAENGRALTWETTETFRTEETYALCRCGRSASKPFCDGSHARAGFDGTETADTAPTAERQIVHEGHGLVVRRDLSLCMHARFCVGRLQKIPAMMAGTDDTDVRAHVIGLVEHCPSGSYTYRLEEGGPDVEQDLPEAIAVTSAEEPFAGPLWVTGRIPIFRADGQPFETRNRVTLCRCGRSRSKPLCDGSHLTIGFREDLDTGSAEGEASLSIAAPPKP
jgi:CDGSH-type Zn-finger protein